MLKGGEVLEGWFPNPRSGGWGEEREYIRML
jgi:hypothetical protein